MKTQKLNFKKYILFTGTLILLVSVFMVKPVKAQIDHNYGLNNSGLRISAGGGVTILATHYHSNPISPVAIGRLDYDFNPYLTLGLEAQAGTLKGVDKLNRQYYQTATNQFLDANANIKIGVGLISDFTASNAFQDALKRIYIGVGVGRIHTENTFTTNSNLEPYKPESTVATVQAWTFHGNFGTNIDLPGVLGRDRLSLNPNYQFTFVNSYYLDGFRTSNTYSFLKGFYSIVGLNLRYKF